MIKVTNTNTLTYTSTINSDCASVSERGKVLIYKCFDIK